MTNAVLDEVWAGPERSRPGASLRSLPADLRQAREQLTLTREALADCLAMPKSVCQYWQQLVQLPPDELHAHRADVRAVFDGMLEKANLTAEALPDAAALAGGPLDGTDRLPAARQELARFVEMILTRWKSRDDLVQLMIDTIDLPEWVLKGPTPEHLRPPQSWWDDVDDDPFQPLPDAS